MAPSEKTNILWIESSEGMVRIIRYKSLVIKNRKINQVTYIPSFYWDRKSKLLEHYKKEQKSNKNMRYQIWLRHRYKELWTKFKDERYFRKIPVLAFGDLPPIEDSDYSPIKERIVQTVKRPRSESPNIGNK